MLDNGFVSTKPQLELEIVDDHLPFPLPSCLTSFFLNGTYLVTVTVNGVMPHLGILLHLFNFTHRDMALL